MIIRAKFTHDARMSSSFKTGRICAPEIKKKWIQLLNLKPHLILILYVETRDRAIRRTQIKITLWSKFFLPTLSDDYVAHSWSSHPFPNIFLNKKTEKSPSGII